MKMLFTNSITLQQQEENVQLQATGIALDKQFKNYTKKPQPKYLICSQRVEDVLKKQHNTFSISWKKIKKAIKYQSYNEKLFLN